MKLDIRTFALLLAIAALVAFYPLLDHPSFYSDDFILLVQTRHIAAARDLLAVNPDWCFHRPFVFWLWSVVQRLFGQTPLPFQLVSLALHTANALALAALIGRIGGARHRAAGPLARRTAVLAALLFLLLPVAAETVAFKACWFDLVATLGYLGALLGLVAAWSGGGARPLLASVAAFQIALWSKETAFTLPAVAMALGLLVPGLIRVRSGLLLVLPHVGLLGVNLWQRWAVWGCLGGYGRVEVAAAEVPGRWAATLGELLAPLSCLEFGETPRLVWFVIVLALIALGLLRARRLFWPAIGLAWTTLAIVPALDLLPLATDLRDGRFLYLPSAGVCMGLGALLAGLAGPSRARGVRVLARTVAALFLLANAWALRVHLAPWVASAHEVPRIVAAVETRLRLLPPGTRVVVSGIPGHLRGAHVLACGVGEALEVLRGLRYDVGIVRTRADLEPGPRGDSFRLEVSYDRREELWRASLPRRLVVAARSAGANRPRM